MPGLVVFALAFTAYAWTASPAIGWLDSPELVAAAAQLGVAHSPGHPPTVLLGRLATLVPLGDVAIRVNLMSAACGAAAAAALYAAARRLIARCAPAMAERLVAVSAAAIALGFALSASAWRQSGRAEVYALEAALLVGVLAAVLAEDAGALYLAGLLAGLALANHHFIALTCLVPCAVAVWARRGARRPGARASAVVLTCGALGLACLAYLPVRAAAAPEVSWGAPDTAGRFWWTVSAAAFQRSAVTEHASSRGQDAAQIVALLLDDGTALAAAAVALALWLGLRRRGHRRAVLLCAGVVAVGVAARVLLGFDPETPDHQGYLLPALAAWMLLCAAGAALLFHHVASARPSSARAAQVVVALALAALPAIQVAAHARALDQREGWASDELGHLQLDSLPPRTLLLVSYFQTSFRIWAMHAVEGARPDVAVLDRSFLTYPGAADQARARYPSLAALIDAPLQAGAPTPLDLLAAEARRRPVAVELHVNLDDAVHPWLQPRGLFAWFGDGPADERARAASERFDHLAFSQLAKFLASPAADDRRAAIDTLLWQDFVRLRFYCSLGRRAAAADALAGARALAATDEMLDDEAARCGL